MLQFALILEFTQRILRWQPALFTCQFEFYCVRIQLVQLVYRRRAELLSNNAKSDTEELFHGRHHRSLRAWLIRFSLSHSCVKSSTAIIHASWLHLAVERRPHTSIEIEDLSPVIICC